MCNEYKLPIYSIVTGIIITLMTGLFPNVFLFGVSYWGYFLPWSSKALYPGAPLEIMWINFIVDIIIWTVFIYLALLSIEEEKMMKKATAARTPRARPKPKRKR